ncbi:Lipoprotein Releasing System Transmembrane Protein [Blattabacterium sp. (Nauphoeta cinerea)]|uniref:ABC transporter permease n=1 Tax=Blattabacterium sp. (Nauphoeta cinerea) TaxID=1316444 RepID=UPI0003B087EE|nr:FtsX-like permease family protein [Blattabacterium sp. (Nauphoeta cinerea)]AGW85815.1 Lipoprotein Releasing System Transmembrane Protein [Blattabacterium sp. (Nauphoeta cinerea)]
MNTYFYISIRYFFSKKKTNLVNIIVFLSILSIGVSAFSLSTILFVFSGLENLNEKFHQTHYPDITISCFNEKDFFINDSIIKKIEPIQEIMAFSKTIEKKVFLHYNNHEYFVLLKGVDVGYEKVMKKFIKKNLKNNKFDYLNVYIGWSYILDPLLLYHIINTPLQILFFDSKKDEKNTLFFMKKKVCVKGIFHFSPKMDIKYLFCDLYELQNVIKKKGFQTLEIKVYDQVNIDNLKNILMKKLGSKFNIITRVEREKSFHKVLNTEKIFIYFLFILITLITGFNLFSAIYILQLDKLKEIFTLWSMGFSLYRIKMIFFYIGFMITTFGCLSGLFISYIISLIQEKYKIFKIEKKIPFPVKITIEDSYMVVCVILIIGSIISFYSLKRINNMIYYK